jgi:hypothetical protein
MEAAAFILTYLSIGLAIYALWRLLDRDRGGNRER